MTGQRWELISQRIGDDDKARARGDSRQARRMVTTPRRRDGEAKARGRSTDGAGTVREAQARREGGMTHLYIAVNRWLAMRLTAWPIRRAADNVIGGASQAGHTGQWAAR